MRRTWRGSFSTGHRNSTTSPTGGAIDNLDAVVTVDTAVAHLAGARTGKPVFLLLAYVPDWRWLLNRDDSPWYPTAKLFRQPVIGDWQNPLRRIADELQSIRRAD